MSSNTTQIWTPAHTRIPRQMDCQFSMCMYTQSQSSTSSRTNNKFLHYWGLSFHSWFPIRGTINCIRTNILQYTGCFKKSFTNLKAYRNLYRGYIQRFELSKCSKTHRVLPRIVIRNCFDLFFQFLFHGTSTDLGNGCWGTRALSKVTYNFESVQRTYTTFWTVKM
jgi:hypothetical protein